jgi:hypothetical protein
MVDGDMAASLETGDAALTDEAVLSPTTTITVPTFLARQRLGS